MALIYNRRILGRRKTLDLLGKLVEYSSTDGYSLYLPPNPTHAEVDNSLREMSLHSEIIPTLAEAIEKSPAGAAVFWAGEYRYLVIPSFPVAEKLLVSGLSPEILISLLEKDYTIAWVMVRLGAYAIGVSRGDIFLSSKVGTGNIHSRHKKGGSSAHRFERHRDKQMEYFFTRVCQHAREHLEPQVKELDYLVYGGARITILELIKQCSFLGKLDKPTLPPLLDIPEARRAVLDTALCRIWLSTVYEWREED